MTNSENTRVLSDREKMNAQEMNRGPQVSFEERVDQGDFRIIVYGNSITRHGVAPKIGWNNCWGMAASSLENDFAHRLIRGLEARKNQKAAYIVRNISQLESNSKNYDVRKELKDDLNFAPDYLIIALGENVPNGADNKEIYASYRQRLEELIQVFCSGDKKPVVLLRSPFWKNAEKNAITRDVAKKYNALYVDAGVLGDAAENKAIGKFEHSGVANHPGDLGMERLAQMMLDVLP